MDAVSDKITLRYVFKFKNGTEKDFTIRLDNKTLRFIPIVKRSNSEWAKLKNFKCPNCPLEEPQHEFCPIATNIIELIDYFKDRESNEEIDLLVETKERNYLKRTSLQAGLSSLLGIYMVSTGCPILEKLKPMVRYHLPFATLEETTYRVVTMYLLAQFFLRRKGENPDWDLKNLSRIYNDILIVNNNVCDKLQEIITRDASVNAVVKLKCSAFYITLQLNTKILDEIEPYFNAYLF